MNWTLWFGTVLERGSTTKISRIFLKLVIQKNQWMQWTSAANLSIFVTNASLCPRTSLLTPSRSTPFLRLLLWKRELAKMVDGWAFLNWKQHKELANPTFRWLPKGINKGELVTLAPKVQPLYHQSWGFLWMPTFLFNHFGCPQFVAGVWGVYLFQEINRNHFGLMGLVTSTCCRWMTKCQEELGVQAPVGFWVNLTCFLLTFGCFNFQCTDSARKHFLQNITLESLYTKKAHSTRMDIGTYMPYVNLC